LGLGISLTRRYTRGGDQIPSISGESDKDAYLFVRKTQFRRGEKKSWEKSKKRKLTKTERFKGEAVLDAGY